MMLIGMVMMVMTVSQQPQLEYFVLQTTHKILAKCKIMLIKNVSACYLLCLEEFIVHMEML